MRDAFYYNYLVAFVDVLGQKEAFSCINSIPINPEEKQKLIEAHKQTVGYIEILRKSFHDYFKIYTEKEESKLPVPADKKEHFDNMRKAIIKHTRFSDCIQLYVPLGLENDSKYYSPKINGIFGVFGACGGILLTSLAVKKPFRVGIDVGIATELDTNEVYGPAFFNAYKLEHDIAKYPRIVVGENLMKYLYDLSKGIIKSDKQIKEDIEYCRLTANNCLRMIAKDSDGVLILDYLGKTFYNTMINNLPEGPKQDVNNNILNAFKFIESAYNKFKADRDSKLEEKYLLLYNYFKERLPVIGISI